MIFIDGLSIMRRNDGLLRAFPHPTDPRAEIVIRQLAVLVRVPGDLEQRQLHEIEEVLLNVPVRVQVRDVLRVHRRELRIVDANLAQLVLQLDELREVRHQLCLAGLSELEGGEDQAGRDRE